MSNPEETAMKEECDKVDEDADKIVEEEQKELAKVGAFKKLYPYNKPRILIFTGIIGSIGAGSAMPLIGVIFSKLLTYSTAS